MTISYATEDGPIKCTRSFYRQIDISDKLKMLGIQIYVANNSVRTLGVTIV